MMAAIERRATVSTQVRSPESPYCRYQKESDEGTMYDPVGHQMYPALNGELSILSCRVGLHRYASHGGIWAYTSERSSATALGVAGEGSFTLFDVDHFFPSSASAARASTLPNLVEMPTDVSLCLSSVYALESAKRHRAASKVIFGFVEQHFAASDLAAVNFLLARTEISRLSVWSISGLLRVTARAKDSLPLWSTRFHEAKKILASRGVDVASLFAGL
jgi:hypothetical protein